MIKDKPRKNKLVSRVVSSIIFCIFVISAFVTYNDNGTEIWQQIFHKFNLTDVNSAESDYLLEVHFLDVGKADCAYIKYGEVNILIDSGDCEVSPSVLEYLNRCGIKKIDLIIASHPHRDHIGQMYNIIDNFDIGYFMMSDIPEKSIPTSLTYRKMLESLGKKNVHVELAKAGDRLTFADLNIDILGPCDKYENLNDNSVIAKITYGSESFLFVGDAEKSAEYDLVKNGSNLSAKVLKVGHHGSKTSTTEKFLRAVNPKYAVISSGPDRSNLPKKEILDRLENFGVKVLRTDTLGDITFLTNGNGLEIVTERNAG